MITRIIKTDSIDSTQNAAKAMAEAGAESGTVITAARQSAGRGQFGRSWHSAEGGLYFSIIARPGKAAVHNGALSLKIAASIAGVLKALYGINTKIKHPNDVLAYSKKRKKWQKICGILIESSAVGEYTDWLAVGVGINLNNKPSGALKEAVSIKELTGREQDLDELFLAVLADFTLKYDNWRHSAEV